MNNFKTLTNRQCLVNYDSDYLNSLTRSVSFIKSLNQITFRDSSNITTIVLNIVPPVFKVNLSGIYSSNIAPNVYFSFTQNEVSILGECNVHKASYDAFTNGTIIFGNFTSTNKPCTNDKDSVYVNSLRNSKSFSRNKDTITFTNVKG
jgi:hypothetical protein